MACEASEARRHTTGSTSKRDSIFCRIRAKFNPRREYFKRHDTPYPNAIEVENTPDKESTPKVPSKAGTSPSTPIKSCSPAMRLRIEKSKKQMGGEWEWPHWGWSNEKCRKWLFYIYIEELQMQAREALNVSREFEGYGANLFLVTREEWFAMVEDKLEADRMFDLMAILKKQPGGWGQQKNSIVEGGKIMGWIPEGTRLTNGDTLPFDQSLEQWSSAGLSEEEVA